MNWAELLMSDIHYTYNVMDGLLNLVDQDGLEWKPSGENNRMTTGQLLKHLTDACGAPICGFVKGDWGLPEGVDITNLSTDNMLPLAEKLPTVGSVTETRELLEKDKQLALNMLAECHEENPANQISMTPWDSSEMILGHRLLQMVSHLSHHRTQLFYYLKLQGKKVNPSHLWST